MNQIKALLITIYVLFLFGVGYIWYIVSNKKQLISLIEITICILLCINHIIPRLYQDINGITLKDIVCLEIVTFLGFDLYETFKQKL